MITAVWFLWLRRRYLSRHLIPLSYAWEETGSRRKLETCLQKVFWRVRIIRQFVNSYAFTNACEGPKVANWYGKQERCFLFVEPNGFRIFDLHIRFLDCDLKCEDFCVSISGFFLKGPVAGSAIASVGPSFALVVPCRFVLNIWPWCFSRSYSLALLLHTLEGLAMGSGREM